MEENKSTKVYTGSHFFSMFRALTSNFVWFSGHSEEERKNTNLTISDRREKENKDTTSSTHSQPQKKKSYSRMAYSPKEDCILLGKNREVSIALTENRTIIIDDRTPNSDQENEAILFDGTVAPIPVESLLSRTKFPEISSLIRTKSDLSTIFLMATAQVSIFDIIPRFLILFFHIAALLVIFCCSCGIAAAIIASRFLPWLLVGKCGVAVCLFFISPLFCDRLNFLDLLRRAARTFWRKVQLYVIINSAVIFLIRFAFEVHMNNLFQALRYLRDKTRVCCVQIMGYLSKAKWIQIFGCVVLVHSLYFLYGLFTVNREEMVEHFLALIFYSCVVVLIVPPQCLSTWGIYCGRYLGFFGCSIMSFLYFFYALVPLILIFWRLFPVVEWKKIWSSKGEKLKMAKILGSLYGIVSVGVMVSLMWYSVWSDGLYQTLEDWRNIVFGKKSL